jgi:hypothetical protein
MTILKWALIFLVVSIIASLPAPQPLVADIGTDPEPSAQLPAVRSLLQGKPHELVSLIHH